MVSGSHTRGVRCNNCFPSLPFARFGSNQSKFLQHKISILKVNILPKIQTLKSNLLSVLFLPRKTTVNFFPFSLLPLPSHCKNHIKHQTHRFLYDISFLSKAHKAPIKVRKCYIYKCVGAISWLYSFDNPLMLCLLKALEL